MALLALGFAVLAPASTALAAATAVPVPGAAGASESATGAGESAGGAGGSATGESVGGSVSGQNQQLSKLTGEASPEEKEEELAEKNAAAVKSTESKPVSTGLIVLIGVVAAALLGGIAFLIVRDARSVAPAGLPGGGSARDRAARQRQRRSKAKAARQARKRNR